MIEFLNQQAVCWVNHTLAVQLEGEHLLNSALDEETGLRGYLLTRNRASLEPYRNGQIAFYRSQNRLHLLVQDNPTQLKNLNEIQVLHDHWQSQFAQKAFSGASSPTIAGKTFYLSLGTVKSYVRMLLNKLSVDDRVQAAAMAVREGLI